MRPQRRPQQFLPAARPGRGTPVYAADPSADLSVRKRSWSGRPPKRAGARSVPRGERRGGRARGTREGAAAEPSARARLRSCWSVARVTAACLPPWRNHTRANSPYWSAHHHRHAAALHGSSCRPCHVRADRAPDRGAVVGQGPRRAGTLPWSLLGLSVPGACSGTESARTPRPSPRTAAVRLAPDAAAGQRRASYTFSLAKTIKCACACFVRPFIAFGCRFCVDAFSCRGRPSDLTSTAHPTLPSSAHLGPFLLALHSVSPSLTTASLQKALGRARNSWRVPPVRGRHPTSADSCFDWRDSSCSQIFLAGGLGRRRGTSLRRMCRGYNASMAPGSRWPAGRGPPGPRAYSRGDAPVPASTGDAPQMRTKCADTRTAYDRARNITQTPVPISKGATNGRPVAALTAAVRAYSAAVGAGEVDAAATRAGAAAAPAATSYASAASAATAPCEGPRGKRSPSDVLLEGVTS